MKQLFGHIILLAFCLAPVALLAQRTGEEVSFELQVSKERLGVNERLRVEFTMNQDGDNFIPPDFEGFRVLMGPSQAISSSWVNGVRSFSKTYGYVLAPLEKGVYTIGQASIVISGNTYKTIPKKVTITEAVDQPGGPSSLDDVADQNLHLIAEVSKTDPYLNEPISVVYKLYFSSSVGVSNFRPLDNPKYNNFWSQEIPFSKYSIENGMFEGQPYRYVVLKRVVLYPQKEGELDIEPLALEVSLEVPTERRNFFGERIYANTNKTVSAGKRTIQVRPLPVAGRPADFTGAVGSFDFKVEASRDALNASESLQATVSVAGKGNLKLFQLPKLTLPSSLEVYDPEFTEDVRTTLNGMQGSVSESYTIVPSFQGKYPIPEISFSYFNPETERYEHLRSGEITINVQGGPTAAATDKATPEGPKTVVRTGDQFYFIKLNADLTSTSSEPFFGSRRHLVWLLGPLALIPLFVVFRRKREKRERDVEGLKIKRANRLAKKYLSRARKELGDKEAFYVALEKALHNYLKAQLKLETSEFSKDKIQELLIERGATETSVGGFTELLVNCEMARYSPFSRVQMQQDYDKASQVITALDKEI